jgi:hypothetical protein
MTAYMAGDAEATVHLRPRRRTWDRNRELRETVDLTAEALTALFGMRAPDAARSVGIGVSTFKKICRRLGIERWPDSRIGRARGRVRVAGVEAPAAPACAETVTALWSSGEGEIVGIIVVTNTCRRWQMPISCHVILFSWVNGCIEIRNCVHMYAIIVGLHLISDTYHFFLLT